MSLKLFVGQVPKSLNDVDLRPLFEPHGKVNEIAIIRDRVTMESKGCAFVTFSTQEEADSAIAALHNVKILPGANKPLQVKYADSGQDNAQAAPQAPQNEYKLFIGKVPNQATEDDLRSLFNNYGHVTEVVILRGFDGLSKGCGFVKYSTKGEAETAIEAVNGKYRMEGGPCELVVKYADVKVKAEEKGKATTASAAAASSSPQAATDILSALTNFASPHDIVQLAQIQAAQQLQVALQQAQAQLAAALQVPYDFGASSQAIQNLAMITNIAQVGLSNMSGGQFAYNNGNGASPGGTATPNFSGSASAAAVAAALPIGARQAEGPPGANLFIYHLPKEFQDADLANVFAPFGNVISAKVFVDKDTGVSKCFGFVSYDSAEAAQVAIGSMNGYQIGPKRLKVQLKNEHSRTTGKPY
ncbi:RNA-binding protein BRN1 [Pelomyxa schiedti]|nr:RNA-binding protein BRN1 [Pelomyxa schiedti]